MFRIVAGTTPTIIYRFRLIDPSDLIYAMLTIEFRGRILIQKTLEDAVIGENTLSWTLTQEETLSLPVAIENSKTPAHMMVNWVSNDNVRGATKRSDVCRGPNDVKKVIP